MSTMIATNPLLDAALAQAIQRYTANNPQSHAQFLKASESMPGGNTRSVLYYDPFPLAFAKGQGSNLIDVDGHVYSDFIGEFSAGLYGHSDPQIRAALISTLENGINLSGHNTLEPKLAALVCQRFALDSVRFTNSGTEANLLAIAAAKAFTQRNKIVVFSGGYHGGVLSFGGGHSPVNVPHEFLLARYNDLASVEALFATYDEQIAAVLLEPMQGAGGCIVAESAFLNAVQDLARRNGALFVLDEVMTSRLAPGGLQQSLGLEPDLTVLGKYIGGGMSFGAFGGRDAVMAMFDPRQPGALPHSGTFNNNVMSMAAGIVGLSSLYTEQVAVELTERGDALRERLNRVMEQEGLALNFSGRGSLMNLQQGVDAPQRIEDLKHGDPRVKSLFFYHLLEAGYYIAKRGFIVLSLPLTQSDCDGFARAVGDFAKRYAEALPAR